MINGDKILRERYPDFDEKSRTPNGLDLPLGKVFELSDEYLRYGLMKNRKDIPDHIEILPEPIGMRYKDDDGNYVDNPIGWDLHPNRPYILQIEGQIKINDKSAQLYLPRSTLLRCGLALHTAVGDSGYNGHLAFLCTNYHTRPFFIEKGVNFAQLLDFEVKGNTLVYDGDFQEQEI